MARKGIGNFGQKTSFQPGDAVWVKDCPRDGVAHIVQLNTGQKQHGLKLKKGTYEVLFNSGAGTLMIDLADLKPATPDEDAKDQAKAQARKDRHAEGLKRTTYLMEKLLACQPMSIDEDNPMSFMGAFGNMFSSGMRSMASGDQDAADLEALRFQDAMAVNMGRSLGYCGAPRADYNDGERVRVRQGVDEKFWSLKEGQEGTVIADLSGLMHIFPVDPMQPKGISVKWDDGRETSIYVTNLEPV